MTTPTDLSLQPGTTALFLDIDGTLLPFADHPGGVTADAGLRLLLDRLRSATSGALALISGRSLADIDALFAPERFAAAGQHGAERRSVDGTMHYHAPIGARLADAAQTLRRVAGAHDGLLLEEKGASLALHYRRAPELASVVEREMGLAARSLGADFEVQSGKFVVELKPSGRDKGTAIAEFMDEAPFAGRRAVFVGDDLTDEFGFGLVNSLGGLSVKVGEGKTVAHWRLQSAATVRDWLAEMAFRMGRPVPGEPT